MGHMPGELTKYRSLISDNVCSQYGHHHWECINYHVTELPFDKDNHPT